MRGYVVEPTYMRLKKYFDQSIGIPFLVVLCIIYCLLNPSPYWLPLIFAIRMGYKSLWFSLKTYVIFKKVEDTSNHPISTTISCKKEALKGTKFDQEIFNFNPNKQDVIFLLVKLGEIDLSLTLIKELELTDKTADRRMIFLKDLLSVYKQTSNDRNEAKDIKTKTLKFARNLSHDQLTVLSDIKVAYFSKEVQQELKKNIWQKAVPVIGSQDIKEIRNQTKICAQIKEAAPIKEIPRQLLNYSQDNMLKVQLAELQPENNRGLYNLGATCYMNSAIQCLHKTFQLTNAIKALSTKNNTPFVNVYLELMEELSKDSPNPFRPVQIKALIGKYNFLFDDYSQHDSGELLVTILNYLNDDLNEVKKAKAYQIDLNIERDDEQLFHQYLEKDKHKSVSIIENLFFGRFFSKYTCRQCGRSLRIFQKFNVLFLPVPSCDNPTLTGCMEEFMKPDVFQGQNGWWCSNCTKETNTDKYMSIYKNSPILIICLKRFIGTRKITKKIDFDKQITLKNISNKPQVQEATYDLYGVINHAGNSIHYGHYYSYCRDGPKWKEYNDQRVKEIKEDQIVTPEAFVLLYRLRK